MNWYDNILGAFSTPNSTAANSNVTGATSSNGSSSWGSFLSGLVNLGNQGVNAYKTVADAGSSSSSSASTAAAAANNSWTKYLPWILIGGGILLIVALFRHGD